jgi:dephospho-CoA kinase
MSTLGDVHAGPRVSGQIVVGVVGGVGSGKSAAARAMARALPPGEGVIADSDAHVREVLAQPEVIGQVRAWWGPGVLNDAGGVDRAKVAHVVFADAEARKRLEGLIHPRVHALRAALFGQARARGARLLIIDAPLLFEAGVDRECDRVVFVDTPMDQRLARVVASRGWSEQELIRRESAQMPLDEKRRRCSDVLVNDADEATLNERAARLVHAWFTQASHDQ